jgi:hypothetical protein
LRAANHSAARARAAAAKRKTFEKSIEQPGGYRSPNACRSGAEAGLIGAYQDLRNSPATGYARMIVCHNSSTIRVGSATVPITASAFRARTGLVSARGAPSLCSLGPEVAIIRKKGRGIVLWRRYARVGDYGPFLRSRCELLCGANAPCALTMRSERPRNGRTFQLSHSREPPFDLISPSRDPCGSITASEWRRVSVTERVPTTCLPLQRVATLGCACRSAHPECRHISALSATLRLQPYDERSKYRLRFNGGQP